MDLKVYASIFVSYVSWWICWWCHLQVTSQHPYAEDLIGEPHVFTVDINDSEAVENAIQMALKAFDNGQVIGDISWSVIRGCTLNYYGNGKRNGVHWFFYRNMRWMHISLS